MGLMNRLWAWILGEETPKEKAIGTIDMGDKILRARLKTYRDLGLSCYIANTKSGKRIIFFITCCRCKKRSNTTSETTARRKKYLCQECWAKQKLGRKK